MSHVTAISFGGGVQTVAMCVLAAQGRIARPDAIIFADTTRERATTYKYLAHFDGWLRRHGLSVTTAGWAYLKQRDPEAFAYAVATERRFPGQYLNSQRKPLPVVAAEAETVMDLFDGGDCTSGYCFA